MKKGTRGLWGIQENHAVNKEKDFAISYLCFPIGIKKSMIIWMGSVRSAEGVRLGACRLLRWSHLSEIVRGAPAR